MSALSTSAPFSRAVVKSMRRLYPETLADKSWDNTGLLLEAPFNPSRRQNNSVLLTVDLTKTVADEAIERKDSIVVSYHPIIFRGLKSVTFADSQQQSLLRLAAEGISVYCPHTAIDAAPGGLGDWLADIITGCSEQEASSTPSKPSIEKDPFVEGLRPKWKLQHHPSHTGKQGDLKLGKVEHERTAIKLSEVQLESHHGAGMGRVVRFKTPQALGSLIERVGKGLGNPKGFPVAIPQGTSIADHEISSVGICAGSGASLFANLDVDLLFTGELSHHEALAAIEKGQCVITLFHSNSERGFLASVLQQQLHDTIREEWEWLRQEEKGMRSTTAEVRKALEQEDFQVDVSERDRDPFGIVILNAD